MSRHWLLLPLLLAAPAFADDLTVTLHDTSSLTLRSCSDTRGAIRFTAEGDGAARFVRSAKRGDGTTLARDGNAFTARDWRAGECATFNIDAHSIAAQRDEDRGYAIGNDVLLSPHALLWQAGDTPPRVTFELADDLGVATSWRPLDAFPHRRFQVRDTPRHWPALVALGNFAARDVAAADGTLRVAVPGVDAADATMLLRFAGEVAGDVAQTFRAAFAPSPQLLIVPTGRSSRAVTFGQTLRGGGTSIVLYVDPAHSLADYHADWTLTHELVHVVHPYLGDDGRWIGEGVATYYQNVIRARAGRITPRRAWRELDAGFGRGRANPSTLTLRETSRRMDRGLYMRAYWSGTAIALAGDVALRTRATPASLDLAIAGALDCCRERGRRDARLWLATLDAAVGGNVLTRSYDALADGTSFPDVAAAYAALGLRHDGDELRFSAEPAAVALRTAIMGGDD